MRKILTVVLILITWGSFSLNAQTVDGVSLSDTNAAYLQILIQSKVFSKKVTVEVDFGQDTSNARVNGSQVSDLRGKVIEFNSVVDALNFFDQLGYEFIESNRSHSERIEVNQYLLRRKRGLDLANGIR